MHKGANPLKLWEKIVFLYFLGLRLMTTWNKGCKNHNIVSRTRKFKMAAVSLERSITKPWFSCYNFIRKISPVRWWNHTNSIYMIKNYFLFTYKIQNENWGFTICYNLERLLLTLVYRSNDKFRPMKTVQCRHFPMVFVILASREPRAIRREKIRPSNTRESCVTLVT